MKILHVSTSDFHGGAARAAYRIHRALLESGVDSRMRVLHGDTGDPTVTGGGNARPIMRRVLDKAQHHLLTRSQRGWHTDNPILHTFGHVSAGLVDELNASDADILHLHWVSWMLSVRDIGRLNKPIVWTLHDMWAFCGGEHYAPDDTHARFRVGYRADNRPAGERGPDLNRKTWEAKCRSWADQRFTIVSPSHWLAECARSSLLFRSQPVHVIANPLDMHYPWRPISQAIARTALSLPPSAKLILMGADGGTCDPRKGGDLLRAAVNTVAAMTTQETDLRLLIYGQSQPAADGTWSCPVHWLGKVRDDRVLALAYSAADVMVVPSRQEAFGQTASEALAFGTPVVAFDIGGLPDIVKHQRTGYLATAFDTEDLAEGILWVLKHAENQDLGGQARKKAESLFSYPVVAEKYKQIYANL